MSGYITGTGSESFDRAYDWVGKDRKTRQAVGVDAAIREGVGEMMQRGGAGGYQPPMAQPWAGSVYSPPGAPQAAPTASPAAPASAAPQSPAMTPAPAQAAPGGPGSFLRMNTFRVEDPTGSAVNAGGYTGMFQFGTGALADAGVYEPSPGEDLKRNAWTGTIKLPSGKRLTHAQFAADREAQLEAWDAHQARLGAEISSRGLAQYIGQTRGGIPITEDTIRALMHIGGALGAQRFLHSDGAYNPADANGTTMSAYAQKIMGGYQGGAGGGAAPSVGGMGLFAPQGGAEPAQGGFNARMDPILSRLAQTPGGGATALSVLGSQSRYDMAQGRRNDAYQRLAMQALGKGDIGVFQYYARIGGLNIPQEIVANAGARQRLAVGSLTAERLYRASPQQAGVFTQVYMQTGDVGQAFRAAGAPPDNPQISVQQVYDAETNTIQFLGVQTRGPNAGAASPITNPDGTPLVAAPRPAAPPQPRVIQTDRGPMMLRPDGVAVPIATEDGAAVAAPPPRPAAPRNLQVIQTSEGPMVLQSDGTATPIAGPDGAQVRPHVANVRQPDRVVRLEMLRKAGFSEQEANAIAAGSRPTPSTISNVQTRVAKMVQDDFQVPQAQKQAEVENRMSAMFGPDWRNQMRGAPGGAAAPGALPQAQQDDGLPTLTPEEARQQPPGTRFRTQDGRVMRVPAAR